MEQLSQVLEEMRYPEKEMMLLALFTGMNCAEIYGLQWKQVSLTDEELTSEGRPIPAKTILVSKQWYRGRADCVKDNRIRELPIAQPLLDMLLKLKARGTFTGPDDFVLVSQAGTPINQNNVGKRRLRPAAVKLGVPSLTWQVILRTRHALASEFGVHFQGLLASIAQPDSRRNSISHEQWRCRAQRARSHSR